MVGMHVGGKDPCQRARVGRLGKELAPGRQRIIGARAAVDHSPAFVVLKTPDIDVVEHEGQWQAHPNHAGRHFQHRADLGRRFERIEQRRFCWWNCGRWGIDHERRMFRLLIRTSLVVHGVRPHRVVMVLMTTAPRWIRPPRRLTSSLRFEARRCTGAHFARVHAPSGGQGFAATGGAGAGAGMVVTSWSGWPVSHPSNE